MKRSIQVLLFLGLACAVSAQSDDGLRPMVVHNIGGGQVLEDCLFDFRIIAHYIYQGK